MSILINKLSQYSIVIYLFYLLWYKEIAGDVFVILYGGVILCTILTLLALHKGALQILYMPKGLRWQYVFCLYCLVTGFFVAKDSYVLIKSLITYFSFLTICYLICINFNTRRESKWLFDSIIGISIISCLCIIFIPFDYYNGIIVKTLGEHNNPNSLAVVMFAGIFSLLIKYNGSLKSFFSIILLYIPFMYTIIQTGSKKGLLSGIILFILWLHIIRKNDMAYMTKIKKIVINITMVFLTSASIFYILYYFVNTASWHRLELIFSSTSTLSRISYYDEALEFFLDSPIMGIGFAQFILNSKLGRYSHSTYAEVVACTGIIGTIIYFYPIFMCGKNLWLKSKNNDYQSTMLMVLYCIELLLGTTNIFMYDPIQMILWTILFYYSQKDKYVN